jgi:hypothetical protein
MVVVRLAVLPLVLLCLAVLPVASAAAHAAATTHASASTPCTAFGKSWEHQYNAAGGPVKIVSACCGIKSARTHNSMCKVMVTGRAGMMGAGMFGCSIATVAEDGNILANRAQACVRVGSAALPA